MDPIKAFNKTIEGFKKSEGGVPKDTFEVINQFRERNKYRDFYSALDELGFRIRMEYQNVQEYNFENDNVKYIPSIKYGRDNPLKMEVGTLPLTSFAYKDEIKASKYLAKEYFYRLMLIRNLRILVFPE